MTGILHEDQHTFLIISCLLLLRIKNVSDKSCKENQNTHFMFSNFLKNCAVYNMEKYCGAGQATDNMATCWKPKATNSHVDYVVLVDFPLQQWLHDAPQCYASLVEI
jgi:hypothetical protein